MKRTLFLAFVLAAAACTAARAAEPKKALELLKPRLEKALFADAYLTAKSQLVLEATERLASLPAAVRSAELNFVVTGWVKVLGGDAPGNILVAVRWKNGGELWQQKAAGPVRIDEWSDARLPFVPEPPGTDRFFGYLGGQLLTGNEDTGTIKGFNGRLGKTFMGGRYDAAVLYSYAKIGDDFSSSSYGLTGRALFPWTRNMGWNVGGSITRSAPSSGDAVNSLGVLGGINYYLPGGSFDVTVALGNHSVSSLLIGYTVYLTRK